MDKQKTSLPPKVIYSKEARLDFIIFRPTLYTGTLKSSQDLSFTFMWWGNDEPNEIRLNRDEDQAKLVFSICCDLKKFQNYLNDAKKMEVIISTIVPQDARNDDNKIISRNFVGKYMLDNLKLSSRHDYFAEKPIISFDNKKLGVITTSLVYTPLYAMNESEIEISKSLNTISGISPLEIDFSSLSINSNLNEKLLPQIKQPANKSHKMSNSEYFSIIKNDSVSKYLSENPINDLSDKHLLQKLFSFVESGAIAISDVPELYQICQGRTPSIDFSNIPSQQETVDILNKSENSSQLSTTLCGLRNNSPTQAKRQFADLPSVSQDCAEIKLLKQGNNGKTSKKSISKLKQNKTCNLNLEEDSIITDISSVVLNVHGIQLQRGKKNPRKINKKGTKCLERPKICYLLEASQISGNEGVGDTYIFATRQEQNGVIEFNDKRIFKLLNVTSTENLKGYLQFRLIRRKMGERLGEELGIGVTPLKDLYELQGKKSICQLFAVATDDTLTLAANVSLSVTFAIISTPNASLLVPSEVLDSKEYPEKLLKSLVLTRENKSQPQQLTNSTAETVSMVYNSANDKWTPCKNLSAEQQIQHSHEINVLNCLSSQFNIDCGQPTNINRSRSSEDHKVHHSGSAENCGKENGEKTHRSHRQLNFENINSDKCISQKRQNDIIVSQKEKSDMQRVPHYEQNDTRISENEQNNMCVSEDGHNDTHVSEDGKNYTRVSEDGQNDTRVSEDGQNYTLVSEDGKNYTLVSEKGLSFSEENIVNAKRVCGSHVNVEILDGSDFPLLHFNSTEPVAPNCYVQMILPSQRYQTSIIHRSTEPKWQFKTQFFLSDNELLKMGDQLLFVVFHSLEPLSADVEDPVIGFATLDVRLMKTNFESLCGWIPVQTKNGLICGSLKVSLYPSDGKTFATTGVCQETQTGASICDAGTSLPVVVLSIPRVESVTLEDKPSSPVKSDIKDVSQPIWQAKHCVNNRTFIVEKEDSCERNNEFRHQEDDETQFHQLSHYTWMNKFNSGYDTPCASYVGSNSVVVEQKSPQEEVVVQQKFPREEVVVQQKSPQKDVVVRQKSPQEEVVIQQKSPHEEVVVIQQKFPQEEVVVIQQKFPQEEVVVKPKKKKRRCRIAAKFDIPFS